ncbi:sirohydrochlorin chelatase [Aureibacillus halotolerans]|uniref:Sirohydrochlorin ferrochelatase/sirohydrochlorin cobaltochelatase n=1 Tax=Aureibacillus halotolerans TaxID=1508390 RepID=A0A4R6U731_9BACI|nr:sirohydrochlorin chelatase [Aureibacillus halotolerans]TDQ40693.1 sirohydrochlorin ferrochelatase/sirohydrochlorin cobaltochelatase [Aureibacillus halotolerans]
MKSILYVCHGTRSEAGQQESKQYIRALQSHFDVPMQITSFLELTSPTIPESLDLMIKKNVHDILIMPILLFSAGHAKVDIPTEADRVLLQYPHVRASYGQPIGDHKTMPAIVEKQVASCGTPPSPEDTILIVGRGSRDDAATEDFEAIVEAYRHRSGHPNVETCYLAVQKPTFQEAFENALAGGTKVYVVPYLVFTGLLMNDLEKAVQMANHQGHQAKLATYLSKHSELMDVFIDRVKEGIVQERLSF